MRLNKPPARAGASQPEGGELIVRTLMLLAQNKDGSPEWRGAR